MSGESARSGTRRDWLRGAWRLGWGLLGAAGVVTTVEALRPLGATGPAGRLTLAAPDAYAEGTATYVREGRLFVTRARGELFAVTQRCPHLGCRVPFCEASGRFECPCHGSVYDLAGEWIAGPSPRGMDRFPLRVVDGRVEVRLDEVEEGFPLGADAYLTPSRGGSCAPGGEGR
jgi:nitrite reductase/ring-hydroxylating ferredoxin subunit